MGEQRLLQKGTDSGETAGGAPEPQRFHFPLNVPAHAVPVRALTLHDFEEKLVSSKTRVQAQTGFQVLAQLCNYLNSTFLGDLWR